VPGLSSLLAPVQISSLQYGHTMGLMEFSRKHAETRAVIVRA
jgi:hypothetical protein